MSTRRLTCPCGNVWDHPAAAPVPADVRSICPSCTLASTQFSGPPPGSGHEASAGTMVTNPTAAAAADVARQERAKAVGPGRVIAGYEVLEEINRGGMGVIYKARQPGVNRLVALKIITPGKLDQPGTRGRFKREVRASGRMNDPCIVTIYQTELDGPVPFVAMEYVPGIDLLRLVRQTGPLPVADVVYYARQVAEGLQHAFEVKLVHRDIKPSNLMISPSPLAPEGRTGRLPKVKILDMGLARLLEAEPDPETDDLTHPGVFVGTPDYVSPEQAENPRAADTRSDLYSLGGAMYFCLTGEVPFPGKTLAAKLRKQLTEPPPSAASKRSDVPVGVDAVIRKLMALEPNDRYQTPAELVAALEDILRAAPPKTGTKTAPAVASVFAKAHDGGVQALAPAPDGSFLISGGGDGQLKLWHPATLKELRLIGGDVGTVESLAVAPSGKWVATCAIRLSASDMGVQLWDLGTGAEGKRLRGPTDNIAGVAVSPDGKGIAAASADKMVWLWLREASGPTTACIKGHTAAVTGVAFVSAESLLSSSLDGTVRQWDLKTGKVKGVLQTPVGPIAAMAFAAKRIAVAGRDGLALRQPNAPAFQKLSGHDGPVRCCALSADGQLLASGGSDRTVRLYRAEDGLALASYPGHDRGVRAVAFSPSGDALYSGGEEGTLRRWPVPKAK